MKFSIASDDIAPILVALGGFVTVVGGFVVQTVILLRQNKRAAVNHADVAQRLGNLEANTGTHKTLPGDKGSGP